MVFVDRQYRSENFNTRRNGAASIDMVLLHYTDLDTLEEAIARLCDPEAKVSAHYVVAKDGRIFGLVDEDHRAWHAGVACWQGETDINGCAIGIELDYPGHRVGLPPYPEEQIRSLIALLQQILPRYTIPLDRVLGHEDVAPERKIDPGENFPWQRLVHAGVAERKL